MPLFKEDVKVIENWVRRNFSFVVETILGWENSMDTAGKPAKDLQKLFEQASKIIQTSDKPLDDIPEIDHK